MRQTITLAAVAAAIVLAGCGDAPRDDVMTVDLERDLELARVVDRRADQVVSTLEGGPRGGPSGTHQGKRDVVARQRRAPTASITQVVNEAPAPVATDESAPVQQVAAEAIAAPEPVVEQPTAPAPAPTPEPVVTGIPRSGPSAGDTDAADRGRDRGERPRIGVIIRGGGVGDDDCEAHDRMRDMMRGRMGNSPRGRMPTPVGIARPGSWYPRY